MKVRLRVPRSRRRNGHPAPARAPDPDALASIGIDLEEVRRRVEEAFGHGALERTRAYRKG